MEKVTVAGPAIPPTSWTEVEMPGTSEARPK
jgi:hypothetical protein